MSDKTKRRWYQFSLKTLLVVLTLLCLGPGSYVAHEQAKARRQKAAVEAIEKLGGDVHYDPVGRSRSDFMRAILGNERFGTANIVLLDLSIVSDADLMELSDLFSLINVHYLSLDNTRVTDAGLLPLSEVSNLTILSLVGTKVSDSGILHIARLKKLQAVDLSNTQVTDAGLMHLASLSRLRELSLSSTHVTDDGVARLQRALPNCKVSR